MQPAVGRAAPGSGYLSTDRCLAAVHSLATLAGLMALLSAVLLLQLRCQQPGELLSPVPGGLPRRLLRSVSQGLASLSVSLHLCCLLLALMQGYLAADLCGGQPDRSDWILLNSRPSRHVALSAFCLGVIVYLAAFSIYVLLEFEKESAMASAGVLAAGVLVLFIIIIHAVVKARCTDRSRLPEHSTTMFENNRAPRGGWPEPERSDPRAEVEEDEESHLPAFRRETAYERYREQKAFYVATSASRAGATPTGRDGYGHARALSAGRSMPSTGPWDGVTHEMRRVLAHKGTVCRKDSTLV
ncbi:transmembrane protein 221 [Stegostoma tigrinum]|uniref:transmembrane protein 221 n=1 Tax=Stegostoma tigrinum TaxID=3053191 RepID=UPI00202AECBE|nr:transmembrane protein 221 [Stegostoma tigrinum]